MSDSSIKKLIQHTPQWLLFIVALCYESLVLLRLSLYQRGLLKTYRSRKVVISVGNINAGGSGKTPVVDYLAQLLETSQYSFAILSRGYRRKSCATVQRFKKNEGLPMSTEVFGDEPYLLASKHPEVPVYVGRFRALSAQLAEAMDDPQFLLLDDAYQHLAIHRDLNLLLIDAAWDPSSTQVLPLGDLREPEHHWNRADAILITRSNLGFSDRTRHYLSQTLQVSCPVFSFDYLPQKMIRLDQQKQQSCDALSGKKVLLLCGIAHPKSFTLMVEQCGAEVMDLLAYKDHHSYSEKEVQELLNTCKRLKPDLCLTTEKDAVKLRSFQSLGKEVWALQMEVVADPEWDSFFMKFLRSKVKKKVRSPIIICDS